MELLADLRRWRRQRRARRARRTIRLPEKLERGTADALVELSRHVGTEDWDASVRRIVRFDAEMLQVERVSFWSLHEEPASIHLEAGYVASRRAYEHGATLCAADLPEYFEALREVRAIDMYDVQSDPRCRGLREYCAARGIASMLDIPVWLHGRLSGVLCHEHVGPIRRWNAREEEFATSVSQVVCAALQARDRGVAEAARRRASLLDGLSCVLPSLDAREVARRAVSMCVPRLADAMLVLIEDRQGALECVASKHADGRKRAALADYQRALASRPDEATLGRLVLRQRQSLLVPEFTRAVVDLYRDNPPLHEALVRLDLCSVIAVPLSAAGRTFGAITFLSSTRRYDAEDLSLAEGIATRAGAALENARLYEMARDAIRARDELLVLAAHELRTPMTALQLTADQLVRHARQGGDEQEAQRSEKVARQVRRFGALVDNILEALSIRAEGGVVLACRPCDLAAIVRDRVALVQPRAQSAGSAIALDAPEPVTGAWDPARLQKVVDALLDNAIKFGDRRPIEVSLRVAGTSAELSVRDRGIGFSAERLSALFDPFERGVAKENFGGLGLGLFVAKAIVDAHGGTIEARSQPGEGSTFVVRLPLAGSCAA